MIGQQTWALFVDAYRELNAKKMFWITLGLSGVIVIMFASIGFDQSGFKILWFETNINPNPTEESINQFYDLAFNYIGFKAWLTIGATVLALISTASLFPDLMSSGAIDLILSKPIGRIRLFFTKWLTGMMFTLLQITIFTVGCFFALGLRADFWLPQMFWAIPLVVLFYSYLFSVCVLIGILTRSTLAALLLTLLFWAVIFGIENSEYMFYKSREHGAYRVAVLEKHGTSSYLDYSYTFMGQSMEERPAEITQEYVDLQFAVHRQSLETQTRNHRIAYVVKTLLPKAGETTDLLRNQMYPDYVEERSLEAMRMGAEFPYGLDWDETLARDVQAQLKSTRGPLWVIGTSLLFEAVVLALAGWLFVRRDY